MESLITSPQGERAPARKVKHIPPSQLVRIRGLAERRKLVSHGFLLAMALVAIPMALGRMGDGTFVDGIVSQSLPGTVVPPEGSISMQTSAGLGSTISPGGGISGGPNWYATQADATRDTSQTPADTVSEIPEPTPAPVQYTSHEIVEGDTLNAIAEQYGVSVDHLLWNNPMVGSDPDSLIIGQSLLVPGTAGLVYDVRLGDTVNDISARYGVDPSAVVAYAPNNLASPDTIVEGMVLVLPGAVPPPPPEPVVVEEPAAPVTDEPVLDALVAVAAVEAPVPAQPAPAALAAPVVEPAPSYGYIWPAAGRINSYFGPRWGSWHSGIDIGAAYGAAVVAAGSGQVILSTYSGNGYGNYVIVKHADGSQTLYSHMTERYVGLGQWVSQGEVLGTVGCTGWCTGPHLHFEIQIGGTAVDPLAYLP